LYTVLNCVQLIFNFNRETLRSQETESAIRRQEIKSINAQRLEVNREVNGILSKAFLSSFCITFVYNERSDFQTVRVRLRT